MYAVIGLQGHQYKVEKGEEILVDSLGESSPEAKVFLIVDDKKVYLGKPTLEKAAVKLKVLAEEKGEKIHVQKYKAKSRYRKKIGFRPQLTRLQVESITIK